MHGVLVYSTECIQLRLSCHLLWFHCMLESGWIHVLSPTLDSFKMPAALPMTSDSFGTVSFPIFK